MLLILGLDSRYLFLMKACASKIGKITGNFCKLTAYLHLQTVLRASRVFLKGGGTNCPLYIGSRSIVENRARIAPSSHLRPRLITACHSVFHDSYVYFKPTAIVALLSQCYRVSSAGHTVLYSKNGSHPWYTTFCVLAFFAVHTLVLYEIG